MPLCADKPDHVTSDKHVRHCRRPQYSATDLDQLWDRSRSHHASLPLFNGHRMLFLPSRAGQVWLSHNIFHATRDARHDLSCWARAQGFAALGDSSVMCFLDDYPLVGRLDVSNLLSAAAR